jgi:hypothetical protein
MATAKGGYGALVKEAFIDPIRSVLIVDDDYPTWDDILDAENVDADVAARREAKSWRREAAPVLKVISNFRKRVPALIVDIYDGHKPTPVEGQQIASHLHQCDMLVLDYELEGHNKGGDKSIGLARDVLENSHFNLIVFHTKVAELSVPFNELVFSLLSPSETLVNEAAIIAAGQALVENAEDEARGLSARLLATVEIEQYLYFRHPLSGGGAVRQFSNGDAPYAQLRAQVLEAGFTKDEPRKVFFWVLKQYELANIRKLSSRRHEGLNWAINSNTNWLRTDKGFITFANKKKTNQLINVLQKALEAWGPSPSRLLSAKFRAEIEERGVIGEDRSLSNKHVYAQFYNMLSKAKELERKSLIEAHVDRQSEQLTGEIKTHIVEFGLRIAKADPAAAKPEESFSKHYGVDLAVEGEKKKALDQFNSYVSSKPVSGWHLNSGHIFKVGEEVWVCVSPSCDMAPNNSVVGIAPHQDRSIRSFVAAKLYPRNSLSKDQINSNNFVFLSGESGVEIYCFYAGGDEGTDKAVAPTWRLFVTPKHGKFGADRKVAMTYFESKGKSLRAVKVAALVVGQLRYEYALNLIQKLGANFTRVGLDFAVP